jgi:hypothetical protein
VTAHGASHVVALFVVMLGGCDALFGLDRIDLTKDGGMHDVPMIDAALPPCNRGYPSVPLVDVPLGPYRSVSGDFNKDSKQDLAIASTATDTVEILLGNGDGTFAPRRSYTARNAPSAIATADIDSDNDLDLVVANDAGGAAGQISVLLGNGDGTFAVPTNTGNGIGILPRGIALADLDKDGNLDAAVANYTSGTVGVLLGNGDGTFDPSVGTTVGVNPYGIVVADFNEDGKVDIATANNGEARVGILINTSSGAGVVSFATVAKIAVQAGSIELAVADLDDNTHADLAVANSTANTTSILLGSGTGAFAAAVSYDVGVTPRAISIVDVDQDGKLDVLASNLGQLNGVITVDGTISLLRGVGNGALETAITLPTVVAPMWITTADFDNDEKLDLAVLSRDIGFLQILLDPDGTLPTALRLPSSGPLRGAATDLDGDGRSDLAVSGGGGTMLDLFVSGGGVLTSHTQYGTGATPYAVAFADLDGDTIDELAVSNYATTSSVWVRKGLGGGAFAASHTPYTVVANPTKIAAGDLDNDGDLDLAVSGYSAGVVQILRNAGGTLTVESSFGMGGSNPIDMATHDLDKDGRLDIVVSNQTSNNVVARLATGATTYGPLLIHATTAATPYALAIADLDRNGKSDVALANNATGTIGVLSGTGDGTFASAGTFPTTASPWGLALGDFDGDGTLDAATVSNSRNVITIVHGLDDGRFAEMRSYAVGLGPTVVIVGDYDGDGYPDLAVPNRTGDSISVLRARCLP